MMKHLPKAPKNLVTQLGILVATPAIALLASCATPTGPVAHRHGAVVHSHVLGQAHDHSHEKPAEQAKTKSTSKPKSSTTPTSQAKKKSPAKVAAPKITPAKPEDIKGFGLFHKHHNHVDPITGQSGVPC